MFKKIKKLFSRKVNKNEHKKEPSVTLDTQEELNVEQLIVPELQKKTVLVFDQKRRLFITKEKNSIVALFCPVKKEFYIRQPEGSIETIRFNPLDDTEFAYPIAGDWTGCGYDGIGLYYPKAGLALLKNEINNDNNFDISLDYQVEVEYLPLAGNWDGKGVDTLCFYDKDNAAFLFPEKEVGSSVLLFGKQGGNYIPISGDWNDDGSDAVGLYEPETSLFRLKSTLDAKAADFIIRFGKKEAESEFLPISGNWKGEGADSFGIYEKSSGLFRLKNELAAGKADSIFKVDFQNLLPLSISIVE